ncbi:phage related protein [Bartonella henselae str. Houston-1]|uniref:Phage related protein n=2 Tax=Bartonellaceae TaxID=772 RepID=A0A0H3LY36_BARHE|nr:phage related protein [Bartonella henselae str. Houston-1]
MQLYLWLKNMKSNKLKMPQYINTLYCIKILKDFADVKARGLRGFIEKESNLSHEGDCRVHEYGRVFGFVRVYENAKICGNIRICVQVYGHAEIFGKVFISKHLKFYDNAKVYYDTRILGFVCVYRHVKFMIMLRFLAL